MCFFVCFAWPGSGGRYVAMQMWGKWFKADIREQLGPVPDSESVGEAASATEIGAGANPPPRGFDAHAWLRVCGLAKAVAPLQSRLCDAWAKTGWLSRVPKRVAVALPSPWTSTAAAATSHSRWRANLA